ncbi:MAG: hypothetical protein QM368_04010 [Bacillota bacterium]|nr:hypothetical protein [Bacillota bacterium]
MKKMLLVLMLAIVLTGCMTEVKEPNIKETEIFYTEEKLKEVMELAEQAFEYKDGYLMLVQYESEESYEFIKNLSSCTSIATALYDEGHDKLAEVFDNLGLAGKFYSLWKDSGKGEHYTTATSYYNEAERLYNNLK